MTDAQKVEKLIDLLSTVINTLELTEYNIEDPEKSYDVVKKANDYYAQMLDIIHPKS